MGQLNLFPLTEEQISTLSRDETAVKLKELRFQLQTDDNLDFFDKQIIQGNISALEIHLDDPQRAKQIVQDVLLGTTS